MRGGRVQHRHLCARLIVARVEVAPLHHVRADGGEVAGADIVVRAHGVLVTLRREPFHLQRGARLRAGEDPVLRQRSGDHARRLRSTRDQVAHERREPRVLVAGALRVHVDEQQLIARGADVRALQPLHAAHEHARAHEQEHGERDLRDDEHLAQPEFSGAAFRVGHAAPLRAQCLRELDARRAQRGDEAEENCGGEREQSGEREHAATRDAPPPPLRP